MEEVFRPLALHIALAVEMFAVVIVGFGAAAAFVRLLVVAPRLNREVGVRKVIWRDFGMWLLLGLEFELAADIVRSVVAPTWQDTGQLAAIAVIRTFLNYFLEKDLREATDEPASRTV